MYPSAFPNAIAKGGKRRSVKRTPLKLAKITVTYQTARRSGYLISKWLCSSFFVNAKRMPRSETTKRNVPPAAFTTPRKFVGFNSATVVYTFGHSDALAADLIVRKSIGPMKGLRNALKL